MAPHICPKCNGERKIIDTTMVGVGNGIQKRECPTCLGAGVLWEPHRLPTFPPRAARAGFHRHDVQWSAPRDPDRDAQSLDRGTVFRR